MLKRLHLIAAATGFATILVFWLSAVLTELFGSPDQVANVRRVILWGLLVLVPALVVAGATGSSMAGASTDPRITAKKRRMAFVAAIGLLLLVPAAFYLDRLASGGKVDALFHLAQTAELAAGAVSLVLMSRNVRDGLRISGRLATPAAGSTDNDPSVHGRRQA
ncbi:hypothetical protein ACFP2T_07120 [Plantactinospora solaniradicis]|uniref:Transmembrane protein n=1 Tax=Plantactinospora solaniradicis TaxID=1723736 RepID=A0ABW1K3X3_9ACTN